MYLIIPFLAGFRNTILFLAPTTIYTIARLVIVIKLKKFHSKYEFTKEILNKAMWLIYNSLYIYIYVADQKPELLRGQIFEKSVKGCSYGILILILSTVSF